jgi:hypothetical protein
MHRMTSRTDHPGGLPRGRGDRTGLSGYHQQRRHLEAAAQRTQGSGETVDHGIPSRHPGANFRGGITWAKPEPKTRPSTDVLAALDTDKCTNLADANGFAFRPISAAKK